MIADKQTGVSLISPNPPKGSMYLKLSNPFYHHWRYVMAVMPIRKETIPQPAITCLKLTIETLEQDVKYVQS